MSVCPLCGFESPGRHLSKHWETHGAVVGEFGSSGRSEVRLLAALDHCDSVAAERAADEAIRGGRPQGLHPDDRLAAAFLAIRKGNRYAAGERLGVNGQTLRHLCLLADTRPDLAVGW